VHDPAKILLDLAVTLAVGGDCLADIGLLRAEPDVCGSVASDLTLAAPGRCRVRPGPDLLLSRAG
jgi:hypothetical protein